MRTIRGLILASIITIPSLYAADGTALFNSRFEVQQHLFASSQGWTQSDSGLPAPMAQMSSTGSKSVGLAAIYSLLVPGMGELYAENFGSGKYFLIAEAALWLTYTTFEVYGNSLRDDARSYAASHAGINAPGKDDQFYVDVGNFLNVNEYNEKKLRDREPEKLYNAIAGYAWQWDSDGSRATYREQRISSENMYNNRGFVIGAILINHVASAINAARSAISHNKDVDTRQGSIRFKADVMGGLGHPHGIVVTISKGL